MTPSEQPMTQEKMQFLLSQGQDFVEIVQVHIRKFNLPYYIDNPSSDVWVLKANLNRGEEYLARFITCDPDTIAMKRDAALMAPTPYEVLICGDTGTGKELIAQSQIWDRLGFIKAINCAGLPRELLESELFGYKQGAFTGAQKERDGLIATASKGVLFMDEIGELPLDMQGKLLRVLQNKSVRKVGSSTEDKVDCKFVFATNRNLKKMVDENTFRKDLYARISTLELDIKPLSERRCDIELILKSLPGGEEIWKKYGVEVDLSLNVRSLQKHVIRNSVLGRI